MEVSLENDPMGHAVADFVLGKAEDNIVVKSNYCDDDVLPIHWLFRKYEEMPVFEKKALDLAKGTILDVGSGAGCHALALKKMNKSVVSIELSQACVNYQIQQGIDARSIDFFELKDEKYDSILLLMNGIGICGTLERLPNLLKHLYNCLNPGGQILCDSTDISYLYEDEEGASWIDLNASYYGNFSFQMIYKETVGDWFNWLYVDAKTLLENAQNAGFTVAIEYGAEGAYFAQLLKP
jgi:SAM-dependent methyltransferase